MAECGICLDVLRNPVSLPCGHVHCERCLRNHINSGTDALRSACPTCRSAFHTATPDFAFVPQKYHNFILPSVRKIYMDIPSLAATVKEAEGLRRHLESLTKENDVCRQRTAEYKRLLENAKLEKKAVAEQEKDAREDLAVLRKKYDNLKRAYRDLRLREETDTTSSPSSQSSDVSDEILPKEEELPVSLQDSCLHRPKRSLPRNRLAMHLRNETASGYAKRQRTLRYSDVGYCSQRLDGSIKDEDEEDE